MFAAWEVGAWRVLREHFQFDMVVGTSAGSWNGWGIAGGITPDGLEAEWLEPGTAGILQFGLHRSGCIRPEGLLARAHVLYERSRPVLPFGVTLTEVPRLRARLFRGDEITWRHLAAACSIPLGFPPVEIDGTRYVDGGLLGVLPLWAAEEMGATRAIALNCLTAFPFRMLRTVIRPRRPSPRLRVDLIEPSVSLGSLRDAVTWSPDHIRKWIELGRRDATGALTSITM